MDNKNVISKEDVLQIGLNLNSISMLLDDSTYIAIKPRIDAITEIVKKYAEGANNGQMG